MELISMEGQVGGGYKTRNLRDLDMQAVHHFAVELQAFFDYPIVEEELTQQEEESVILIVDDYHDSPPERDWGGIGYSFVVFPSARVYLFGPLTQQRAGVGGNNHHVVSWCIAGDFTEEAPHIRALLAGIWLGGHIQDTLGLTKMPVKPHCYWGGTACPGDTWEDWVPDLESDIHEEEEPAMDESTVRQIARSEIARYEEEPAQRTHRLQHQILDILLGVFSGDSGDRWKRLRKLMDYFGWGKE